MDQDPQDKRGIVNKGTGPRTPRERNVPLGNVIELVPKRLYNVIGFDIGKANLDKPGISERLEPIVQQLLATDDVRPSVIITGHASESRFRGKGPELYERGRAEAVKNYLVSRGVNKNWIQTKTSGSGTLPASSYSPSQKAAARAATIEIVPSGQTKSLREPPRIRADTRPQPFKLTRWGVSSDTFQHFRDVEKKQPFLSEWDIKHGIDLERHSLRWVERGQQYNSKMQDVFRFKSIKSWGTESAKTESNIDLEVEEEARRRVFRFLADTDPSFRDLLVYDGGGDLEAGLRKFVGSNYAK